MTSRRGMTAAALAAIAGAVWAQEEAVQPSAESTTTGQVAEELSTMVQKGLESLEWGLLIEVEGSYFEGSDGSEASDIILATVEFVVDAAFNDWLSGHVGLLYEQFDTEENNLDEAYITVGGEPAYGFYTRAGQYYLPFGNFESAFISDPLTLELAEIRTSSAMAGWVSSWIDLNAGAFRGDVKQGSPFPDGDPTINDFYASATVAPLEELQAGVYWISDLMETDGLLLLGDTIAQEAGYEKEGGAGAFINVYFGPLMLNAEYVSSINGYDLTDGRLLPAALNLEGSYTLLEKYTVGLKYEASNDLFATRPSVGAFADKFPEKSYGGVIVYGFHDNASIGLEYLRLEELEGDIDGHLVTAQLAVEI